MDKWILADDELRTLDHSAVVTILYLLLLALASFGAGIMTLESAPRELSAALIGTAGSAVAALTSCLDRYANGFEREAGEKIPPAAKENADRFNRRFSRWLAVRPFLGAIVAPVFIWGIAHFTSDASKFLGSTQAIGFTAFMAGLLAKSVIELIKGLFKNVFKA